MHEDVQKWRTAGRYLPKFMRDFHDQKDIFKTIHQNIDVENHDYASEVDWRAGQCYVIDIFLWFMAQHGYTLQRISVNLPFDNIDETVAAATERRNAAMAKAMGLTPVTPTD